MKDKFVSDWIDALMEAFPGALTRVPGEDSTEDHRFAWNWFLDITSPTIARESVNNFILAAFSAGFEMGRSAKFGTALDAWEALEGRFKPTQKSIEDIANHS